MYPSVAMLRPCVSPWRGYHMSAMTQSKSSKRVSYQFIGATEYFREIF